MPYDPNFVGEKKKEKKMKRASKTNYNWKKKTSKYLAAITSAIEVNLIFPVLCICVFPILYNKMHLFYIKEML